MPFQKGRNKTGGKTKGSVNKSTAEIKEAFSDLIRCNIPNLTMWLEQVAEKDPAKALSLVADLAEYVQPKLARTELHHDGEVGVKVDFTND